LGKNGALGADLLHANVDDGTAHFELTLPARPENVAVVRHAFGGLAEAIDLADQTMADIKLAVTEACTNVVVHAYPNGDGPIIVTADLDSGAHLLTVVVADEGRGIVPRPDSPGLGLGLPLIATLADSLELDSPVDGRTEVRMTFSLNGQAPDDAA
jgi:serine/threonine-protein kinase RsbW